MARCPQCGADLPDTRYTREIRCTYCSSTHPNPHCLRADDEVLVRGSIGLELARVATCTSPDAITVAEQTTVFRLEDLIPVARATDALESGTGVYRRAAVAWAFTYTSSPVRAGMVKVKHESSSFQDSFFDQDAALADIRVDARPPELGGAHLRRGWFGALAARFRDSPGEFLFDYGLKGAVTIIFIVVGFVMLRAFLW